MSETPNTELDLWVTPGGERFFLDRGAGRRGSEAPFYPAYRQRGRTGRYGWFCSHCDSVDALMDPMGSIECTHCENRTRPTRRDAGYL